MSTASSEEKGGFIEKVKDFIQDIGEKIEEAVGFGKPTADVTAIHIPSINLDKADIVVDVLVTNPNPVPIPLVDINYLVESDGRKLVSGLIPDAGTIHAHGSETVKIPLTLVYDDIKNTYDDIHPGSIIPYRIKVDLIVDVPVFGRLTLPLEKTGEIPIPYKPDVDLEKIRFKSFSFEETVALLHLKLENMNDFDLGLNALESEIWLSGVSIGGAQIAQSTNIGKKGITYLDVPITFRPKDLGSAVWEMIRGKGTGYSIKGNIDVDTPFGAMKLPITKEGGTTKLKKNKEDREEDDDDDDEEIEGNGYPPAIGDSRLNGLREKQCGWRGNSDGRSFVEVLTKKERWMPLPDVPLPRYDNVILMLDENECIKGVLEDQFRVLGRITLQKGDAPLGVLVASL